MIYADLASFIRDTDYNPARNANRQSRIDAILSCDPKKRKTPAEIDSALIYIECSKLEEYLISLNPRTVAALIYFLHMYKAPLDPLANENLVMYNGVDDDPFEIQVEVEQPAAIDEQNVEENPGEPETVDAPRVLSRSEINDVFFEYFGYRYSPDEDPFIPAQNFNDAESNNGENGMEFVDTSTPPVHKRVKKSKRSRKERSHATPAYRVRM